MKKDAARKTPKKITPKQQRFVDEYLIDLNATAAYKRVYDSKRPGVAEVHAHRLVNNPVVQEAIFEGRKKIQIRTEITQDRVLAEYAKIAFADVRKFYDEEGNLRPVHLLDDETAGALAGIELDEIKDGEYNVVGVTKKIKITDKLGALNSIGKHLGMFVEKHEHKGPGKDGAFLVQISKVDEDI